MLKRGFHCAQKNALGSRRCSKVGGRVGGSQTAKRPGLRRGAAVDAKAALGDGKAKKVLMMGGTRFIGVYLARLLVQDGHDVTLFTRGKAPVVSKIPDDTDEFYDKYANSVGHVSGDRRNTDEVKQAVSGKNFDVVFDLNAREQEDPQYVLDALPNVEQYIYCSSAGVYLKSDVLPHSEDDAVDPQSRHKGKLDSEQLLKDRGVPFTSIRPVYIYGPLNYNPVEEWFFERLANNRPLPIPGSGMQITSLGHVKDLARAFKAAMDNPKAANQVMLPTPCVSCSLFSGFSLLVADRLFIIIISLFCLSRFTTSLVKGM